MAISRCNLGYITLRFWLYHVEILATSCYDLDYITLWFRIDDVRDVGHLRIVLLRLYELMVEVKVVRRSSHELPCAQERLYQQTVQLRGGIEVIALARVRGVGRVGRGQF